MTDWETWSRILDVAQDPRHRDAVQQFLAQADLSAEIPTLLDEKFLAPSRADGASGEECAYLLCNLGFAALVAATGASAEFAIACAQVAEPLAPGNTDLELRRHFLLAKGTSTLAIQTGQPHLYWAGALERCAAYLRAIDRHLQSLPDDAVEPNAMAAYSFSGQLLLQIRGVGNPDFFGRELSALVSVALALAGRLPEALVSRLWSTTVPGTDVAALLRQTGVAAEHAMQFGADSTEHASAGLLYVEELLSESARLSDSDRGQLLQSKAELMLLLGQGPDAAAIAERFESSPSEADQRRAAAIRARHQLMEGDAKAAAGLLAGIAPTSDTLVEDWCVSWLGEDDSHWISNSEAMSRSVSRQIVGLQAIAALEADDPPGFVAAADRLGGFLVDSFCTDSAAWAKKLNRPAQQSEVELIEPMAALGEALGNLPGGTVLVQVALFENELLTAVARRSDGESIPQPAMRRVNARPMCEAHKAWSLARFDALENEAHREAGVAAAFSCLVDEVSRALREPLQELLADGVEQIVFIGDDAMNLPLHAMRIGTEDERLIDRIPVSYAPSLNVLRASIRRIPTESTGRAGVRLGVLADVDFPDGNANVVASLLASEPHVCRAADDADFWGTVAASRVLHIDGRFQVNGRLPLESVLDVGDSDVAAADLVTRLRFAHCDVVSAMASESSLATMARPPGFDLAAIMLTAGARSVLASCWEAEEDLVSTMTRLFFEHWAQGTEPGRAFRDGLLALRSARPSLPDHRWAGIRLVGAP
jgi:hypothetical protein